MFTHFFIIFKDVFKHERPRVLGLVVLIVLLVLNILYYANVMTVRKINEVISLRSFGHPKEITDSISVNLIGINPIYSKYVDSALWAKKCPYMESVSYTTKKNLAIFFNNVSYTEDNRYRVDTIQWLMQKKDSALSFFPNLDSADLDRIYAKYRPTIPRKKMKEKTSFLETQHTLCENDAPLTVKYGFKGRRKEIITNNQDTIYHRVDNNRKVINGDARLYKFVNSDLILQNCYNSGNLAIQGWEKHQILNGDSIVECLSCHDNVRAPKLFNNDLIISTPFYRADVRYKRNETSTLIEIAPSLKTLTVTSVHFWGSGSVLLTQPFDISQRVYTLTIDIDTTIKDICYIDSLFIPFDEYPEFKYVYPSADSVDGSWLLFYSKEKIKKIVKDGLQVNVMYTTYLNVQQARTFLLTMTMTLLLSWIVQIILKIFRNVTLKKKYAVLADKCFGSVSECANCPLLHTCKRVNKIFEKQ